MKFTHIVIRRREYISSNEDKVLAYHDEAVRQEKIARAAPELLEALQQMIGALGIMIQDPDSDPYIAKARAAIAKAKE